MPLHSELRSRERVLAMGSWGTGKSEMWCSVAKWLPDDRKVFVLDTDNAVDRLIEGQAWESKVVPFDLLEWKDYQAAIDSATKQATRDDWLVLDMADKPWEAAQDFYVTTAFGSDPADFLLKWRTEGNKGSPLAGDFGVNWQIINKHYNSFAGKLARFPGHVLGCTPADKIQTDSQGGSRESKEVLDTFGKFGVKPRGQKHLGHLFHTIILTQQSPTGWTYTTIKDRHRAELKGEKVTDFVTSYLVKVGGWKL